MKRFWTCGPLLMISDGDEQVEWMKEESPTINLWRGVSTPAHYFALMRALCICIHPLHTTYLQSFLPPNLLHFLLASTSTHHMLPDFVPPQQVAVAHWTFTRWPRHFFIFLDALELWSGQAKKRHAFSSFPRHFLLESTAHEAYNLLSQAYHDYDPIYNAASKTTSPPSLSPRLVFNHDAHYKKL